MKPTGLIATSTYPDSQVTFMWGWTLRAAIEKPTPWGPQLAVDDILNCQRQSTLIQQQSWVGSFQFVVLLHRAEIFYGMTSSLLE